MEEKLEKAYGKAAMKKPRFMMNGLNVSVDAVIASMTAHATKALRQLYENGFQEWFQSLYTGWQKCVTAEGNYFEENV